ncbi:MAG: phosphotransferase [Micrococcaceae bacterium]
MKRTPFELAALASAAVPDMALAGVQQIRDYDEDFDSALIMTTDGDRLVIRAPQLDEASTQLDTEYSSLQIFNNSLRASLPFAVPSIAGRINGTGKGQATVYRYLPGQPQRISEGNVPDEYALSLGSAIAAIHNLNSELVESTGLTFYSAEDCRNRKTIELNRAVNTGRVPRGLVARWRKSLDDDQLWNFTPTVVHGQLNEENILVENNRVIAIQNWAELHVGDPAEDLAWILATNDKPLCKTVFGAYTTKLKNRPDRKLLIRAEMNAEFALAQWLLHGYAIEDTTTINEATNLLQELDTHLESVAQEKAAIQAQANAQKTALQRQQYAEAEHQRQLQVAAQQQRQAVQRQRQLEAEAERKRRAKENLIFVEPEGEIQDTFEDPSVVESSIAEVAPIHQGNIETGTINTQTEYGDEYEDYPADDYEQGTQTQPQNQLPEKNSQEPAVDTGLLRIIQDTQSVIRPEPNEQPPAKTIQSAKPAKQQPVIAKAPKPTVPNISATTAASNQQVDINDDRQVNMNANIHTNNSFEDDSFESNSFENTKKPKANIKAKKAKKYPTDVPAEELDSNYKIDNSGALELEDKPEETGGFKSRFSRFMNKVSEKIDPNLNADLNLDELEPVIEHTRVRKNKPNKKKKKITATKEVLTTNPQAVNDVDDDTAGGKGTAKIAGPATDISINATPNTSEPAKPTQAPKAAANIPPKPKKLPPLPPKPPAAPTIGSTTSSASTAKSTTKDNASAEPAPQKKKLKRVVQGETSVVTPISKPKVNDE